MKATKSSSTRAASCCCGWRLQCRVVILSILALAVAANGARVEALRTVLDPNGLPLLLPARSPSGGPLDDDSCRETTTTRAWGGLRRVDLTYLGSFAVQHSSTTIKRQPSSAPRSTTDVHHIRRQLAGALLEAPGGTSDGDRAAPLLLLGGHVCALSLKKKEKQLESAEGFTLREPYAWESDLYAAGFMLPRWMWNAVGGETGGGALLIHPNTSSPKEQSAPGHEARGPSRAHNAANFSEPFVQVALWGDGEFHPLLRATSTGLSFEGGPGRVEKGASNRKAISTEEGDLEISPAAGLHLLSGTEQGSDVRIETRGKRGGVYLISDVLHWVSSSNFANSPASFAADESSTTRVGSDVPARNRRGGEAAAGEGARQGTAAEHEEASFRIDEDTLEARGLATVKLGASRSFDLNVVGWRGGGAAAEPNGGAVRGDLNSVNASAGTVNVQALDRVLVSGANGARVTSATGDVCVDASDGASSLRLSGTDIQGAAPMITFSAGAVPDLGMRAFSGAPGTTTGLRGAEDLRVLGIVEDAAGGYLNLTGTSAAIGGPGDVSVKAGNEVCLRANGSVLRVSMATVAIKSPTVLLQSPPLRDSTPTIEGRPPPGKKPSSSSTSDDLGALLSLTGGVLAMNASASIEWETPGAFARLVGRRDSRTHEGVLASGRVGVFVADADVVEIRARLPAGVMIAADGAGAGGIAGGVETVGKNAENSTTGARLEVSAEGVSMEGISTTLAASRRLTLRAGGQEGSMGQKGSPVEPKGENVHKGSTAHPEGRGVSTVELGDGGVKVIAPSSQSIVLRAGTGVVLEAPQLAISHNLGGETTSEDIPGGEMHRKTSDGKTSGGDGARGGGGGGGGGLWSDGISLTGRADRRVLLQAGPSDGGKTKGDEAGTSRSQISIEEDRILVRVGGARKLALAAPRAGPAAKATGGSGVGAALPGKGLSLEVVGMASLLSTEDLEVRAQEVLLSSSNQTTVYSPGGLLLAGSPTLGSGAPGSSKLDAARVGLGQKEGHILLAPGVGAAVGIGPVFSSQDLLASVGSVPSLLYVTNATHPASQRLRPSADAHMAVESSGNSAVAVLSPRGAESAVRFGCAGLPYSGGLAVRHHLDARARDTLLLELASSPGRIVGDASGRWGVGAVPEPAEFAATLHVFALPKFTGPSGAGPASTELPELATAFLIESAGAGVMQLLSGAASSPQTPIANAVVLTSRPGGNEPKGHTHWVMSQVGDEATVSRPPAWTDALADRSSWAGGMTLTHVSGGGSTGWRSALATLPPTGEADSEKIARARPHLALSSNGRRSGFGTGPTGARVTIGGALLVEQILFLSDEGMIRDIDALGNQGRDQAMEAMRQVNVVSFGWTEEASASYGLRPDVRQLGVIAQQVEKEASPSLVWQDATTGRKAVSYSRLLATLVAAFQHLDRIVNEERKTRDNRLEAVETDAALGAESCRNSSDRLRVVEAATEAGVELSKVHARDLAALEGRLLEQGGQVRAVGADLAALQRNIAEKKGDIQEWRIEGSRREQELEREVIGLKSRLAILEERRKDSLEANKIHQKAQDEQIQALSLRIGTSHASQSRCDSSLLAEVAALRASQGELESRLAPLLLHHQAIAHDEEAYFLEEVERLENRIIVAEIQRENGRPSAGTTAATAADADDVAGSLDGATRTSLSQKNDDRPSAGGAPLLTAEIRQTLENHKDRIRAEAVASLLSRREHLEALRQMSL